MKALSTLPNIEEALRNLVYEAVLAEASILYRISSLEIANANPPTRAIWTEAILDYFRSIKTGSPCTPSQLNLEFY